MRSRVVLYAPNVHTGGGYVLLRALLQNLPCDVDLYAFLDQRAATRLPARPNQKTSWVKPSLFSRFKAELDLRAACQEGDLVLCFHGLPTLLPNRGHVVVFQQNRNYLGLSSLFSFSARTAIRLGFERLVSRLFRHRVSEYIVQTPTMARDLHAWYGQGRHVAQIRVFPFMGPLAATPAPASLAQTAGQHQWDFIYAADGEAHKNHMRLFQAWRQLAEDGLRPTLAVTLAQRDGILEQEIRQLQADYGVQIVNLGQMPHEQLLSLYRATRALIFPSLSESFGLPLIEAQQLSVPIVASELDFVRDVCTPVQTFDPLSPVSIARAVKRFLEVEQSTVELHSPTEFWQSLMTLSSHEKTAYATSI